MNALRIGWSDIAEGAAKWRIWYMLGSSDVRSRYARTRLGQFWISLSLAISSVILGFVWSILWGANIREFLPYVVVSLTLWGFLSNCLSEATDAFMTNKQYILGQKLEISIIIYALMTRNVLFLLHNMVVVIVIFAIFQVKISWTAVLFIPGVLVVTLLMYLIAYFVAIVSLRFTDVKHMIASAIQLLFYITPVIWRPDFLSEENQQYLFINPFYWFMSVMRDPLIGDGINGLTWLLTCGFLIAALLTVPVFTGKYIRRVAFWV